MFAAVEDALSGSTLAARTPRRRWEDPGEECEVGGRRLSMNIDVLLRATGRCTWYVRTWPDSELRVPLPGSTA
eukprot:10055719-Heterocapsa_arctica.AAC.1